MHLPHRVLEHRARALVALLALLLAASGLAACGDDGGSGGGGSSADAETLLTRTFSGAHRMSSGTVDLRLRIDAQGGDSSLDGPIELTVTGPFQAGEGDELPRFDFALDAGAEGQSIEAGLLSTSERLFVRIGETSYEVPGLFLNEIKESYREARRQGSGSSALDLGDIDPMSWLRDPEVVGTEDVGGVETDHIRAEVDVSALLDDIDSLLPKLREQIPQGVTGAPEIPERIPEDTRAQIEEAIKEATVDVWTGRDDRTLRKLTLQVAVEPPADAEAPDSLDVDFSIEFGDLNEPQTIEAPTSTRPFSELLGQLQGLLGGAMGGSGSGGGATPNIDEYTQCLQEAGGDAAEAQKCAALLNP